jgi:hypothetical protein
MYNGLVTALFPEDASVHIVLPSSGDEQPLLTDQRAFILTASRHTRVATAGMTVPTRMTFIPNPSHSL